MEKFRKLLPYLWRYWGYALLNIIFNILSILFSLVSLTMLIPFLSLLFKRTELITSSVPWAVTTVSLTHNFNYFLSKIIIEKGRFDALVFIAILIVILFFLRNLTRYLALYLVTPLRTGVIRDIRDAMYKKILILPQAYFNEQRKGDLLSRISSDVMEVEWSIMNTLMMLFRDPFSILLYLITLFLISTKLTLLLIILLPVSGYLISLIGKQLNRISKKGQEELGGLVSVIDETIHGLRIIKAYNAIHLMNQRFRKMNTSYTRLLNKIYRRRDLSHPVTEFLAILQLVIVIWFGGKMVLQSGSNMSADVFLFYLAVFSQIIPPAKNLITAYYYIEKGIASLDRVDEVLKAEEIITQKPEAMNINSLESGISYRDVSFVYDKEPVLRQINLEIEKGRRVALVGPSGGGKSTLVDLLPRFYDVTAGEILIDGINIKDFVIDDLRGLMGIVTQETILFNDTVFNNIAFGLTNVSDDEVVAASKIANAHDFIMEMPQGYQTNIGDRGVKMSGGQRQRLSIARAILRNPPILILDEATSSLDTESERLVQDALDKALKNRTSIIIAHRLTTVQSADEIIVLKEGQIVEKGNHEKLIQNNGLYKTLYQMQFSS